MSSTTGNATGTEQAGTTDSAADCRFEVVHIQTALNVRQLPDVKSAVVDHLHEHQITHGSCQLFNGNPGHWYRVYGEKGILGYASANFLRKLPPREAQPEETVPNRGERPPETKE